MTNEDYMIGLTQAQYSGIVEKIGVANYLTFLSRISFYRILALCLGISTVVNIAFEYAGTLEVDMSRLIVNLFSCALLEGIYRLLVKHKTKKWFLKNAMKQAGDAIFNSRVKAEINNLLEDVESGS